MMSVVWSEPLSLATHGETAQLVPKPEEVREAMLRVYGALRQKHSEMTWREASREIGKRHGVGEATVSRLLPASNRAGV